MALVIEVEISAIQKGRPVNNIFHVTENTGLLPLTDLTSLFEVEWVDVIRGVQSSSLSYTSIRCTPLDIFDTRAPIVLLLTQDGAIGGNEFMPTGQHIHLVLDTAGFGLKSGGKLVGGLVEADFVNGQATIALLDAVQVAITNILIQTFLSNFPLTVYRPTFSIPGAPTGSLVTSAQVRGAGTNNRRQEDFQR